jgi:hypothetical protein
MSWMTLHARAGADPRVPRNSIAGKARTRGDTGEDAPRRTYPVESILPVTRCGGRTLRWPAIMRPLAMVEAATARVSETPRARLEVLPKAVRDIAWLPCTPLHSAGGGATRWLCGRATSRRPSSG